MTIELAHDIIDATLLALAFAVLVAGPFYWGRAK